MHGIDFYAFVFIKVKLVNAILNPKLADLNDNRQVIFEVIYFILQLYFKLSETGDGKRIQARKKSVF
jgi:hypothetical protein